MNTFKKSAPVSTRDLSRDYESCLTRRCVTSGIFADQPRRRTLTETIRAEALRIFLTRHTSRSMREIGQRWADLPSITCLSTANSAILFGPLLRLVVIWTSNSDQWPKITRYYAMSTRLSSVYFGAWDDLCVSHITVNHRVTRSLLRPLHSQLILRASQPATIPPKALASMEAKQILDGVPKAFPFGGFFRPWESERAPLSSFRT